MPTRVRIGVIGTSWWTEHAHLRGLMSHPGAAVAALCGRNRERAQQLATKHAIPSVFTDYQEMLARGDLDAVIVASPDDQHHAMVMAALEAGLHVLCEKPLAVTSDQARAMCAAAKSAGVKHMTFFTWRWIPEYRHAHHLVSQGYLGRPHHCRLHFVGNYGLSGEYNWRFDRQRAHGVLADLGAHVIDMAQWFYGDITRVSAHLATYIHRTGQAGQPLDPANDAAMLLLEFASGAHGFIQVSAVARGAWQHQVILQGDGGTLELDGFGNHDARLRGTQAVDEPLSILPMVEHTLGPIDPAQHILDRFFGEYWLTQPVGARLFVDAILENRPAIPDFEDGWRAQAVIEAAVQSHQTGRWVAVPAAST